MSRPWGEPPQAEPAAVARRGGRRWLSLLPMILILALIGGQAYQDLSRPQAWAYWRDLYLSPRMTAQSVRTDDPRLGGARSALAVRGEIGPAAASWLRDRLNEAKLAPGDVVVFSSPGGDVDQAMIMGDIIRSRGLATAVGAFDNAGRLQPSYCASACVLAFAGGTMRLGVEGSGLGVHRFTAEESGRGDLVSITQRVSGMILGYMTRMGISSSIVEAMSATKEIRWLSSAEATEMKLTTSPASARARAPVSAATPR